MIILMVAISAILVVLLLGAVLKLTKVSADRSDLQYEAAIDAIKRQLKKLEGERSSGRLSDAEADQLSLELKAEVLALNSKQAAPNKRTPTIVLAGLLSCVGLIALAGYWGTGAYHNLRVEEATIHWTSAMSEGDAAAFEAATLELSLVLNEALNARPNDDRLIFLQAQLAKQASDYVKARDLFKRLVELLPGDVQMLAEYAQASFFANHGVMTAQVQSLFDEVLVLDPNNRPTLALLAINAYQRGERQDALRYWTRLLPLLPVSDPNRAMIADAIDGLRAELGLLEPEVGLEVNVSIDASITLPNDGVIYVVARSTAGGPPLAVERYSVDQMPVSLSFSDADAMIEGQGISSQSEFHVYAIYTHSGMPNPVQGDYTSQKVLVESFDSPVTVVIDRQVQ